MLLYFIYTNQKSINPLCFGQNGICNQISLALHRRSLRPSFNSVSQGFDIATIISNSKDSCGDLSHGILLLTTVKVFSTSQENRGNN